ncbi:MAG: hypothetical protein N2C13_00800 [Chloroflexota bacterium]
MESEMQVEQPKAGLDDHFISFLGGLFIGAVAWAVGVAGVAFIKVASSVGVNLGESLDSMKLIPPPGIDLSAIIIKLPELPQSDIVEIVFIAVPILLGLVVAWVSYRKVLQLD